MSNLRTAAQQALEALHSVEWHGGSSTWMLNDCKVEGAIHALRAALAEPVQEPVSLEVHDRICQDLYRQIRGLILDNEKLRAEINRREDA